MFELLSLKHSARQQQQVVRFFLCLPVLYGPIDVKSSVSIFLPFSLWRARNKCVPSLFRSKGFLSRVWGRQNGKGSKGKGNSARVREFIKIMDHVDVHVHVACKCSRALCLKWDHEMKPPRRAAQGPYCVTMYLCSGARIYGMQKTPGSELIFVLVAV